MKIGVLTYHAEINFGSVLQTYAVQEVFKSLGHEVEIIDRWMDPVNRYAKGPLVDLTVTSLLKICLRWLFDVGELARLMRHVKTQAFKQAHLKLSAFHFYDWKDAPACLDYDVISVGSDQVWNANLFNPNDYLLAQLNARIARMSFAASMGMTFIPDQYKKAYQTELPKYICVSVREQSAVDILAEIGVVADKILDPTLIVDKAIWDRFVPKRNCATRKLVVYVLAEDMSAMLPKIMDFCRLNQCSASVFADNDILRERRTVNGLISTFRLRMRLKLAKIKLCLAADPSDFVREIASATWVATNSFHALMFATIYRKNTRIIKPTDPVRLQMHSRMKEFGETFIKGPLMQESVEKAMYSLEHDEAIMYNELPLNEEVEKSRQWLEKALRKVPKC